MQVYDAAELDCGLSCFAEPEGKLFEDVGVYNHQLMTILRGGKFVGLTCPVRVIESRGVDKIDTSGVLVDERMNLDVLSALK